MAPYESIGHFEPKQIFTTTAATTGAYVTDATYGDGYGYGRNIRTVVLIQAVRAGTMTGVKFKVQGCRDIDAPIWIDVPGYLLSDKNRALDTSLTLTTGSTTTFEDAIVVEGMQDIPVIRVVAETAGANMTTGDSATAWLWV